MSKKNRLAIVGLAAGLLGGGAAGIALTSPGIAVGQTSDSDQGSNTEDEADGAARHEEFLRDTLAPLVENGTITQAQADAVIQALEDARPERPFGRHFGRGPRFGPIGDVFRAAAEEIGVTAAELRNALVDGQTIAEVAQAHDVEPAAVVDAMLAEVKTKLDEAVANERLTQEEADEHLADARERLTDLVNGELPRFERRLDRDGDADDSGADAENTAFAI